MSRLEGAVAMITGAESGMGAATARRFAAEGAKLVLVGLRANALKSIADELGVILVGLVRSIALDYGRHGVRANAVCPGPTRSPMSDGIVGDYAAAHGMTRDEAYAELGAHVPLPDPCEPHEIASACLFLASRESAGITGVSLTVDHGQSALSQAAIPFMVRGVQPQ
jgi:NAD(P)-dependent dehydrogenase (short-subunit alcohol dehydrogenase family)